MGKHMRRSRYQDREPVRPALVELPDVDPRLRDEPDNDPLIDEMLDRLRDHLSAMVALDEWGRPVPWRTVLRTALGPTLERLRDAEAAVAMAEHIIQLPEDSNSAPAEQSTAGTTRMSAHLGWPQTTQPSQH